MLKVLSLATALAIAPALALAAPEGWSRLMEPQQLADILADDDGVRVIQVSGDYGAGHIPGTIASPYADWRGPAGNPGQLPDTAHLQEVVQDLGITADTPVVVVHQGADATDFGTAARVYWTLKSLGVTDLAVLNGGLAGWQAAGLPVEIEPATVARSDFAPELSDAWRVTTDDIAARIEAGEDAALIDARPEGFFLGRQWHGAAERPGTLPGAGNLTYERWFDGNRMVGSAEARAIAEAYGKTDAPMTVSFCNTGHWAAINWFALSEMAEVDNTRLYAESMVEWSQSENPMANVPNRVTYYWIVLRNWVAGLLA